MNHFDQKSHALKLVTFCMNISMTTFLAFDLYAATDNCSWMRPKEIEETTFIFPVLFSWPGLGSTAFTTQHYLLKPRFSHSHINLIILPDSLVRRNNGSLASITLTFCLESFKVFQLSNERFGSFSQLSKEQLCS